MAPPPMVVTGLARRRGIGVGGFLLGIVTVGALVHVAVRMKGIEVAYDLGRERKINTELEEQRRRLHIEIGMLKDPGRVVALARDRLNMGPPAAADIVRLEPGGRLNLRAVDAAPPAKASGNRSDGPSKSSKASRSPAKVEPNPAPSSVDPKPQSEED
jgi:hypothetical protein